MADTVTLKTRLQLKYDSYANWTDSNLGEGKGANFVLKTGEIGICYLPTNSSEAQVTGSQPPQILFKVGNGSASFAQLPWASAKAADVYEWAKQANLPITKEGDGNVVASIAWDETTKGIKFTTASVATSENLNKLIERVGTIEGTYATDDDLAGVVEQINAKLTEDYATKAEAKGYADAKDLAIETAKSTADAAALAIGNLSSLKDTAEAEGFDNNIVNHITNLTNYFQLFVTSFGELFGDLEALEQLITDINDYIKTENYDEVNLVNGLLALRTYLQELMVEFSAGIGDLQLLPENKTVIGVLLDTVDVVSNIIDAAIPAMDKALGDYKTSNDAAVAEIKKTADAAKASIDTFLKSADLTADAIDTLAEIQAQLDAGEASAASLLAEITKIKDGTTVVPNATKAASADSATDATNAVYAQNAVNAQNATNAQTAASASALDSTGVEQVKGIKVNSAGSADSATDAAKLGGTVASSYLLKSEAAGYGDILTKTLASTTYQPKGNYATAAQGALADTAVQPAALNSYYTKTEADAAFMDSTETGKAIDDKIAALNLSATYEPIGAETRATEYTNGLAKNYATAAQGALAASALQSVEAGTGLKVTNKNKIDFDAETIFVFNCGSSTSII